MIDNAMAKTLTRVDVTFAVVRRINQHKVRQTLSELDKQLERWTAQQGQSCARDLECPGLCATMPAATLDKYGFTCKQGPAPWPTASGYAAECAPRKAVKQLKAQLPNASTVGTEAGSNELQDEKLPWTPMVQSSHAEAKASEHASVQEAGPEDEVPRTCKAKAQDNALAKRMAPAQTSGAGMAVITIILTAVAFMAAVLWTTPRPLLHAQDHVRLGQVIDRLDGELPSRGAGQLAEQGVEGQSRGQSRGSHPQLDPQLDAHHAQLDEQPDPAGQDMEALAPEGLEQQPADMADMDTDDKYALVMQVLEQQFTGMDADDNGLVSADELKQWSGTLTIAEATESIRLADANGDGAVSFDEHAALAYEEVELAALTMSQLDGMASSPMQPAHEEVVLATRDGLSLGGASNNT